MPPPPDGYNANFPLINTTFANWQIGFLSNFMSMASAFAVNHVPLTDPTIPSIAGNHTIVELVEQEKMPQARAGELAVYSKKVPGQTDQIFINDQGVEYQYTTYQIYQLLPVNGQTAYFTFLPGNVIVYFGLTANGFETANLLPPIAKNIITVNITTNNNLGSIPKSLIDTPEVSFFADTKGIYKQIYFKRAAGASGRIKSMYYFVLANF